MDTGAPLTAAEADRLDLADPLRRWREEFVITEPDLVYLDGNSLGRLPRRTVTALRLAIEEEWAESLVLGWDEWLDLGERAGDLLAPLIGAGPGEVALCDQTGINLFKLASAAVDATGRCDIVTDAGNFPSDRYILEAIASIRGGGLRVVAEAPGAADIEAVLDDRVAVVALTHVSYRSGAILDMGGITMAAREAGAIPVWDLSHSAGAVPVDLGGCGVDLAIGCTYKYLNGGPGAPAFIYVSSRLQNTLHQPIPGWFGHADQFAFASRFVPANGIRRFLVGTPPILSMVGGMEGIGLSAEVGITAIREKSVALTERFIATVDGFSEVASPRDPAHRGSHVAIRHPSAPEVSRALRERGVIVDSRAPDVVRFGFAPLYNSFNDAWRAAEALRDVVAPGRELSFRVTGAA